MYGHDGPPGSSTFPAPGDHRSGADARDGVDPTPRAGATAQSGVRELAPAAARLADSRPASGAVMNAPDAFPCPFCESKHVELVGSGLVFLHYRCVECS